MYDHVEVTNVKLLEHGMKVIERIFEKCLSNMIKINDIGVYAWKKNHRCNFYSAIDVGKIKHSYMVFTDLEKAFDLVPRELK